MSHDLRFLLNLAERLGVHNDAVIQKAQEYLRLFKTKGGGMKNLDDSATIILCLDLAASVFSISFDKDMAIVLSGLKKAAYKNSLNMVEKILDLDKTLTIADICIQLGCMSVKEQAEKVLDNFKKGDCRIKDLNHPQYAAAAVYTACKKKNVKIDKAQVLSVSKLKPSQWKDLLSQFQTFGEENTAQKTEPIKTEIIEEYTVSKPIETEDRIEEYEIWKERILKEAYAALKT